MLCCVVLCCVVLCCVAWRGVVWRGAAWPGVAWCDWAGWGVDLGGDLGVFGWGGDGLGSGGTG